MRAVFLCLCLTGCGSQANHLGHPLSWPVALPVSAFDNAIYGARRARVSNLVAAEHRALVSQIRADGGATLSHAYDLARIPKETRPAVTAQLRDDVRLYDRDPEALVVALMVLGGA